jgi:hypothetical protein
MLSRFATLGGGGDPYYSYVTLLMTGTTLTTDSSTPQKTITNSGVTLSTSSYKFAPSSLNFNGSSRMNAGTNAGYAMGTGDFTIEAWIKINNTSGEKYMTAQQDYGANSLTFLVIGNVIKLRAYASNDIVVGTLPITAGAWTYVTVTRSGSTNRLFVNGVADTSATNSQNWNLTKMFIGDSGNGDAYFNGGIEDLRITKGIARYTATFTPPTAPLPTY